MLSGLHRGDAEADEQRLPGSSCRQDRVVDRGAARARAELRKGFLGDNQPILYILRLERSNHIPLVAGNPAHVRHDEMESKLDDKRRLSTLVDVTVLHSNRVELYVQHGGGQPVA